MVDETLSSSAAQDRLQERRPWMWICIIGIARAYLQTLCLLIKKICVLSRLKTEVISLYRAARV